jgi:enoyl-CoA hydratase/carnithine racemase
MAHEVAAGPSAAFLASKRLARAVIDDRLSLAAVLRAEASAQGAASKTADYREGIGAFQERRTPHFTGT